MTSRITIKRVGAITVVLAMVYLSTWLSVTWHDFVDDLDPIDNSARFLYSMDVGVADYISRRPRLYAIVTLLVHTHTVFIASTSIIATMRGFGTKLLMFRMMFAVAFCTLLNGMVSIPQHTAIVQSEPSWIAFIFALFVPGSNSVLAPRVLMVLLLQRHVYSLAFSLTRRWVRLLATIQMLHITLYAWATRQMPVPFVLLSMAMVPLVDAAVAFFFQTPLLPRVDVVAEFLAYNPDVEFVEVDFREPSAQFEIGHEEGDDASEIESE
jgi:hypothetical protein